MHRALQYIQYIAYGIGIPLQLLVISAMLRGAYKRFPFVFAYIVALFLATVSEIPAYLAFFSGSRRARFGLYWLNEGILTVLAFLVVIALAYRTTAEARNRNTIRRALVCGAIVFPTLSLLIHYDSTINVGEWMTRVSRDLNFCAALLDLALWTLLLTLRRKDHIVLMLSGALGIQFAGEAIGQSLRQLSRATVWPGNFIIVAADLICTYVWWQTFKAAPSGQLSNGASQE